MRYSLKQVSAPNLKSLINLYLWFLEFFEIIHGKTLQISLSKRAKKGKEITIVFNSEKKRVEIQIDTYYFPIISLTTKRFLLREPKESCLICGGNKNLHRHHIIPFKYFGTNSVLNLVCLCADCHRLIHKYLNKELRFLEAIGGREIIAAELSQITYKHKKQTKTIKKPRKKLKRKVVKNKVKKRNHKPKPKKKIKRPKKQTKREKELAWDSPDLITNIIRLD